MSLKLSTLRNYIPEGFLIVSVIYYWMLTAHLLNPIAIILLAVMAFQVISKNTISGLLILGIFILLNLYLVLALLSELSEFDMVSSNYNKLVIMGTLYIGINLIVGALMFFKYLKPKIS